MTNERSKELIGFSSEALLISVFTIWGYFIAYLFEAGYLHHFRIPFDVIQISLTRTIYTICALFTVYGFCIFAFTFTSRKIDPFKATKWQVLKWSFGTILLSIFLPVVIFMMPLDQWYLAFAALAFCLLYAILWTWLLRSLPLQASKLWRGISMHPSARAYQVFLMAVAAFVSTALGAYLMGDLIAQEKVLFPVYTNRSNEYAVIRMYPNKAVTILIEDKKARQLSNTFYFIADIEQKNFSVKLEPIGPLINSKDTHKIRTLWDYVIQMQMKAEESR